MMNHADRRKNMIKLVLRFLEIVIDILFHCIPPRVSKLEVLEEFAN